VKYRFARAWARVTIGVGFIVLILGCLFALLPFAMETG
jgi:hypothetical protein